MKTDKQFFRIIEPIITSAEFERLKEYKHHINGNAYSHSLKVAYLCYLHAKKRHSSGELLSIVRGALLHDFFLYDCHSRSSRPRLHTVKHPAIALKNAREHFGALNFEEEDMILRHMFPLTLSPPKTKPGWLVCLYDKVASVSDLLDGFGRHKSESCRPKG